MSDQQTSLTQKTGKAYIAGAGPGDPELLTLKAARALQEADVVLYDSLVNPDILKHTRLGTKRIFVGKRAGKPSISQHDINKQLTEHVLAGKTVVRLKGGDPFIFGRGGEEALALVASGLPFEVIPGISSALAVPAYSGIPLTHRNLATSFTVISGHLDPESNPYDWKMLANSSTLVILMGLRKINAITRYLQEAGKPADTPAAIIQNGTTDRQKIVTGELATIAEHAAEITSPAIIIIGEVVAQHEKLEWFRPQLSEVDSVALQQTAV